MYVTYRKYYKGYKLIDATYSSNNDVLVELNFREDEVKQIKAKFAECLPNTIMKIISDGDKSPYELFNVIIQFKDPADEAFFLLWSSDGIDV